MSTLHCTISVGLAVNGLKLLELASEGDSRIRIEGDVELEIKPLRPFRYALSNQCDCEIYQINS